MKRQLNRALGRFGYQISKVPKSRALFKRLRARTDVLSFVQVGANDGMRFDDLYTFVTSGPSRGLVVEPMPDYFERLELNYRNYPSIKPVRTALHPSERSATLYRVDPAREAELPSWAAGIASFLPEHHEFLSIPGEYIVEEQVPCVTLMQLLEDEGIDRLDLLQVDTEGFDAVIIRMLDFEKVHPKVIKYEHVNLTPDDRRSTESLLASRGYRSFIEDGDTIAFDQSLEV